MKLELINTYENYQDFELIENGRNAALRSIVLTLESGQPSYAMVRRSNTDESEFGDKAEYQLGRKAVAALASILNATGA